MENHLQDESLLELQIDEDSAESLESASWWARFSAIVLTVIVLMVLVAVFFLTNSNLFYSIPTSFDLSGSAAMIWVAVFLVLAFCGLMVALLLSFAGKTVAGIKQLNQDMIERGMNALKIYFIIYGILTIIGCIGAMLTVLI